MKLSSLVFAFALAALLIFSFGCAQKPDASVQEPAEPPGGAQQEPAVAAEPCSAGNIVQRDECFANLAKSREDAEICRGIYSVEKMDACYALFAETDLGTCKLINGASLREDCLTKNAVREKSEEICRLIDNAESRAACLEKVVPPCTLVLEPEKRALCNAYEKNDYALCDGDWCLEEYAKNRSDANACALVSTPAGRFACAAVVKGSVAECNSATPAPVRDYCAEIASEKLGTVDGCDYATAGSDYRNRCYAHFAIEGQDSGICARAEPEFSVGTGTSRNQCYHEYALATADVSACPKISETYNRIDCYYKAAKGNRMPSLCNALSNEQWLRDCYAGSILYVDEGPVPSDCPDVASQTWKDKCYYRAAMKTYNQTLCGFISIGPDKDSCDELFG